MEASLSISSLRCRQGEGRADVQHLKFRYRESQYNHSDSLSFEGTSKNVALEEVQNSNRKNAQVTSMVPVGLFGVAEKQPKAHSVQVRV